jgi:hypothetical protein
MVEPRACDHRLAAWSPGTLAPSSRTSRADVANRSGRGSAQARGDRLTQPREVRMLDGIVLRIRGRSKWLRS